MWLSRSYSSLSAMSHRLAPINLALIKQSRLAFTTQTPLSTSQDLNDQKIQQIEKMALAKMPELPLTLKLKQKLGLGYRYPQQRLKFSAVNLYLSIQYQIDYDKFFKKLNAPDVMNSHCLVNFLHVWMICVALMRPEDPVNYVTGIEIRNSLIRNMWTDIEKRARKLNASMNRKNSLKTYNTLNGTFYAFMLGFDEGLLGDDLTLAGAVWRHLFEMRDVEDYSAIKDMCEYIRKNVSHLEKISDEELFKNGIVTFVDFEQKEVDHFKVRPLLIQKMRSKVGSAASYE